MFDNHTSSCDITGDNDHHYHTDELPNNSVVESANDSSVECVVGTPHNDNIVECVNNVVTPVECVNIVTECDNQIAAVQTRAMVANEQKPVRPLNVTSIKGIDIGPDQLIEQQKADKSLNKYWGLSKQPPEDGKPQFVVIRGYFAENTNLQAMLKTECSWWYHRALERRLLQCHMIVC